MEDDNAYLVGLRLTFFLTVLLGLHFLPGMIIFLLLCMVGVFWLLFLLGAVSLKLCLTLGPCSGVFIKKQIPKGVPQMTVSSQCDTDRV